MAHACSCFVKVQEAFEKRKREARCSNWKLIEIAYLTCSLSDGADGKHEKEVGNGWNHCSMHRQSSRSSRRKKNGDKSQRPRGCGATYAAHKAAHGPRKSCVEL